MPGGDRSGPEGRGPGTGRGLGVCNSNEMRREYYDFPISGRLFGRGFRRSGGRNRGGGFGRGRGSGRYYDEKRNADSSLVSSLRNEIRFLKNKLEELEAKISRKEN